MKHTIFLSLLLFQTNCCFNGIVSKTAACFYEEKDAGILDNASALLLLPPGTRAITGTGTTTGTTTVCIPSTTATRVYGQLGSFTTNTANNGGTSADSLRNPGKTTIASDGSLYIADNANSRVLYYSSGITTATRVYGQGGSFTTSIWNKGGVSANSLVTPWGLAIDSGGGLYIADLGNNRVLYYSSSSTTATRVYGQLGSFTTNAANKGGISANSLLFPRGVAIDSDGSLYIADNANNRVLYYPTGSTTATRVYGQGGSFTTNTLNNGGVSANSLASPWGVAIDSGGGLYIADSSNHRVLYYPPDSTTATRVYGQSDSFTTNTLNKGGISADSLYNPRDIVVDSNGALYIADGTNRRVLYYPSGSTTATRVFGQLDDFTTNTVNKGGVSADSLNILSGLGFDTSGRLYIGDDSNNRVLYYPCQ